MMKNRCFIVGAGEFAKKCFAPEENDYMIAADGGYAYLKQMGIKPNLVVGDFDSLGYEPEHENVVRHPVMKDDTDLALACEMAMEKGYETLYIYGATGGRLDHTLAAIQLLARLAGKGISAFLFGDGYVMTAIAAGTSSFQNGRAVLEFEAGYRGGISVFSNTTISKGVYEQGLLYTLCDAELNSDVALGVSNSFTKEMAKISVADGTLIIMWYGNEEKTLPVHRREMENK